MNQKILGAVALFLPALYLGATAYIGKKTESSINTALASVGDSIPGWKIAKHQYQSGFFTSQDELVLSSINRPDDKVIFKTQVQHGPFPGFAAFGASRTVTTAQFPDVFQAKLRKLFGNQEPVTLTTVAGFGGGFNSRFVSPKASGDVDGVKIDWKGADGTVSQSGKTVTVTMVGDGIAVDGAAAPSTSSVAGQPAPTRVTFGAYKFDGQGTPLEGLDFLWLGKSQFTLESINANNEVNPDNALKLGKITALSDTQSKSAGFVDQVVQMSMADMQVGASKFGTFTMNYGLKHVDAAALNSITKTYFDNRTTLQKGASAHDAQLEALMVLEKMKTHIGTIFKNKPMLEIEKVALNLPGGENKLSGKVEFGDILDQQVQSGQVSAMTKINANGELVLVKASIKQFMIQNNKSSAYAKRASEQELQEASKMIDQMIDGQFAQMVEQGYVVEKDGVLTGTFEFKSGQMTLNGKPIEMPKFPIKG